MPRLSRATALKIAAAIALVSGVVGFVSSVPLLWRGAEAIQQAGDTPPYSILVLVSILAPIQIIGAVGAWRTQRWGVVLLLLAAAVDMLSGAPGILFGPTLPLRLSSAVGVLLDTAVIILCLWRDRPMAVS